MGIIQKDDRMMCSACDWNQNVSLLLLYEVLEVSPEVLEKEGKKEI